MYTWSTEHGDGCCSNARQQKKGDGTGLGAAAASGMGARAEDGYHFCKHADSVGVRTAI